jgi:8-oxo-dGTP pyrophosphatase MutT (NUDIX family)
MTTKPLPKIVVGVLGLPIRKDKKFYLTRRHSPGRQAWHNKWQVAGGGLEFGEKPKETLKREIMEELQVTAKIIHPQPIVKTQIWFGKELDQKEDTQLVLITYLIDIKNQEPDFSKDDETCQGGWFTFNQILKLDSLPLTSDIIKEAHQMCEKYALWRVLY